MKTFDADSCLTFLLICILVTIIVVAAIAAFYTPWKICSTFAVQNNLQYSFSWLTQQCLVGYNGHWMTPDSIIQLWK